MESRIRRLRGEIRNAGDRGLLQRYGDQASGAAADEIADRGCLRYWISSIAMTSERSGSGRRCIELVIGRI
jgi:hypothetical protein